MDPQRLKLGQQTFVHKKAKQRKKSRPKFRQKFLKGPVPLNWLARAARLPGRSLHVAIVLRFLAGMQRTNKVELSNGILDLFGVDRSAKYRALKHLEQAGLIAREQQAGRSPKVTLLEVGEADEEALQSIHAATPLVTSAGCSSLSRHGS